MSKDDDLQRNMKKRPASASPYAENYRVPMDLCQRHLINHRLMVSKLSRRELEDKYINLCDENFSMKKRYQEQEDQIKKLKTKLMRFSSLESSKTTKSDVRSDHSKLHDLEEQRHELHEKLKALRNSQKQKQSREKRVGGKAETQKRPASKKVDSTTTRSSSSSNNRNDDGYDEDRDEVSSSTDEDDGPGTSSSNPKPTKACNGCEVLKAEKMANESEFVKMKMDIKFLHKEIQNEKEKSALLGRQLEEKLSYEIMKRNAAENVEMINLTRQVDDMAKEIQRQQDDQRRALEAELTKQADLEGHIKKEKDKNSELFEECERLKKNIERIKENMSEVEIERDFLKRQQENFTKVVDENKLLRYQLEELRKHNEDLTRQIESLREEETVTKSAQKELLEKLKTLQQDNDTLSVLLEGLRTENETLVEEKTVLEQNLKSLEASPVKERPSTPVDRSDGETQTEMVQIVDPAEPADDIPMENDEDITTGNSTRLTSTSEPENHPSVEIDPGIHSPKTLRLSDDSIMRHRRASLKQVRISQILPRITLLQQNTLQDSNRSKPSNAALLLSNSYAQSLAQELKNSSFTRYDHSKGKDPVSPASSNSMDKKRISFQEEDRSSTTDDSPTLTKVADQKSENKQTYENYASYFGFTPEVQKRTREFSMLLDQNTSVSKTASSDDYIALVIQKVCWKDSTLSKLVEQKVQHFYVEFSFLGERGHRLETPQSADLLAERGARQHDGRPPLEYTFDHRVVFNLAGPKHEARRQLLRSMLLPGGRDMVRFLIVHEQVEQREQ
ncbi:X-linked retinitis pigmentosa GTPase regulator-interacting protein 1-like isoform X2 [Armigeres subalbatus]|uniref:X-linked retinitis pigmentosa GTPase regulator-interacting protein 1-like isoform X2 n=1 Tax=Armigeres subalbatus TaxID=124917 RepID=UPI002ED466BF